MSLRAFRAADFQDPLIASAEYKSSSSSARQGRRRAPTTGCRRATGTTPPTTTRATDPYQRRRSVGVRQRGQLRPHDPDARLDQSLPVPGGAARAVAEPNYNQYHRNYESDLPDPNTNDGYSFGTLHDLDAAISGSLRTVVEPRPVRRGGPGPELRDPACRVRGVHRPLHERPGAVDRRRLLAAEQGLADAAVGPLQPRLRPGRQLLRSARRPTSRCTSFTPTTTGRCRSTTSRGRQSATSP